MKLAQVIAVLDRRYPREWSQEWDHIGLQIGDGSSSHNSAVDNVYFVVDVTEHTVAEALECGAQLIVSHHPLFFGTIDSLDARDVKARIAHTLIKNDCALYVAHTNADVANPGVNDALARSLGLLNVAPLVPSVERGLGQLTYYVPGEHHERVLEAVFSAGAGAYRNYDRAAFVSAGTGQFRPLVGANPAIGSVGVDAFVNEQRVEVILDLSVAPQVIAALVQAHPYEEVAYNVVETQPRLMDTGHGRIGTLPAPMSLNEFAAQVHRSLPATSHGVRIAGELDRVIGKVAVCGGSGSDFRAAAYSQGADVFVTADLKHHQVQDFVAQTGVAVIDVAHWASEWPWLQQAADLLRADLTEAFGAGGTSVEVHVSSTPTDPWSGRI